ncbi:hypothetical protein [Hydrotalea sp.]|uniref:hypothetical protein n=1 Tax=Hydrotalea sp. TaxID=2881279 RepID=UPI00262E8613|nr:hypothetical protein [Hydrotalea sp.]
MTDGIFAAAVWKLIFEWKAQGKSDAAICELVVAQQIHPKYATMLVGMYSAPVRK